MVIGWYGWVRTAPPGTDAQLVIPVTGYAPRTVRLDQGVWVARQPSVLKLGLKALRVEFEGTLPCGLIENRPFHRCLHGLGFSLRETGDQVAAQAIFRWGLRLNPDDAIGLRFLVAEWVGAKQ